MKGGEDVLQTGKKRDRIAPGFGGGYFRPLATCRTISPKNGRRVIKSSDRKEGEILTITVKVRPGGMTLSYLPEKRKKDMDSHKKEREIRGKERSPGPYDYLVK